MEHKNCENVSFLGKGGSLTLPSSTLSRQVLRKSCPSSQGDRHYITVSCFVLSGCTLLEAWSFLKRKQVVDLIKRGKMVGVEGGKTVVGMYGVREESVVVSFLHK